MPKAARRAQLLETARRIVRESGTDALSLGSLAERAGVSKPITYTHFETRSGLMIALYKQINDQQVQATLDVLEQTPSSLEHTAGHLAKAYMDCHEAVGPEFHAIAAALKGDAKMEAYQALMIDEYVDLYAKVLIPLSPLSDTDVRRRSVAVIGAADALSGAMAKGRLSKHEAVAELASLMIVWLTAPAIDTVSTFGEG